MHKTMLVIGSAYSGKTSIAHSLCSATSELDTTLLYFAPQAPNTSTQTSLDWHWRDITENDRSREGTLIQGNRTNPMSQELSSHDPDSFLNLISHNLSSQALILDGLNLWWAQLYLKNLGKYAPEHAYRIALEEGQRLFDPLSAFKGQTLVMVSQEMGLGMPPRASSERFFRQGMGLWNQCLGQFCAESYWVIAGKIASIAK